MPEILPTGKRIDDPPEKSALKFRLMLAARKHPVGVAFTIAAVLAAAFLWAVKANSDHFARDDARLSALTEATLRQSVVQSGQRAQAVILLCNVNDVLLNLSNAPREQQAASTQFIVGIERATGVKLHGLPLEQQFAKQRRQVDRLRHAHCDDQASRAKAAFRRVLATYLATVPASSRARERRRLTPKEVK